MSSNGDNDSDSVGAVRDDDSVHYSDEDNNILNGHRRRSASVDIVRRRVFEEEGERGGGESQGQEPDPNSWGRPDSWKDLPIAKLDAPKFCSRLAMFTSAPVTILVGPQKITFNIPKDVLCHHSRYFDCCLNGSFKEARENQVILEEDSVEAFQLIIQWIFTGNLALPWDLNVSGQVGAILGFLKLADKLDLLGSLCSVTDSLRNILIASRSRLQTRTSCQRTWGPWTPCRGHPEAWQHGTPMTYCIDNSIDLDPLRDNAITAQHIRTAFELPSGHEARSIIVNACVSSYLLTGTAGSGWGPPFKFQNEVDSIEGFSTELLEAVRKSVHLLALQNNHNALVIDPLTAANLSI